MNNSLIDHGDHILITESKSDNAGGVVMLGRSDGVLCVDSVTVDRVSSTCL